MKSTVKKEALEQAQETYKKVLVFGKYFCYVVLFLIIVMSWQNWLDDGTGSKGDPALFHWGRLRVFFLRGIMVYTRDSPGETWGPEPSPRQAFFKEIRNQDKIR